MSGKGTSVRMFKLRRSVELVCCEQQHTRCTILRVEERIIDAARDVAREQKSKLASAWVDMRLIRADGKKLRTTVDLMRNPYPDLEPFMTEILRDILVELVARVRQGKAPKLDSVPHPASTWPFALDHT
jgi:hypothetical protein